MDENLSKNRMLILINVVMMTFMATLQGSIINVALPEMAERLSVSSEAIAWVVTIFLIVVTATILVFGKIGDVIGKTKVFLLGIALFTTGSLLCGIVNSFYLLLLARVVQGIGASAAMATNQGIIAETFPKGERGKALGITGSFVALGSLVGPPLGGFFVSFLNWNYIFLINVPIGILVYIMASRNIPRDFPRVSDREGSQGGIANGCDTAAAAGGNQGIAAKSPTAEGNQGIAANSPTAGDNQGTAAKSPIAGGDQGTAVKSPTAGVNQGIAANSPTAASNIALLVLRQFSIFKNGVFSLSILCALISFIAISSSMIIQPFYFQNIMQYSPALTGLIMMVNPLILLFVAPASGHLSDRIGSEFLTFLGLTVTGAGLLLMSTLTEHSSLAVLIVFLAITSLGSGMFQSPNTSLIMSSVPGDKLGIAGSLNAFMRNLGMVIGTALATTLLYDLMSQKIGHQVSDFVQGQESVFIYGMKYVYIVAASICAVGALLTAYRLYSKRRGIKAQVQ